MENEHLSGETIYGDDFTIEQINNWYQEETEAYANLGSKVQEQYVYSYDALNTLHGFNYIKDKKFENVLGLGAAWGHEYLPIIGQITNLTIIEPSDNLQSDKLGNVRPLYTKPTVKGKIEFPDNHFDLVTTFGTLHHIPNISYVLAELHRVTKPGGYILLREPVISMGDWRKPRTGLTKNERGIPLKKFRSLFKQLNVEILHEGLCFCMTAFFQRTWIRFSKKPIFTHKSYVWLYKYLSKMFSWNLRYHSTKMLQRIAPQSVFYVLKKQ